MHKNGTTEVHGSRIQEGSSAAQSVRTRWYSRRNGGKPKLRVYSESISPSTTSAGAEDESQREDLHPQIPIYYQ